MIFPLANNAYMFWCPGCDSVHVTDERWHFNNDFDRPTLSPSLYIQDNRGRVCHLYLTEGQLVYLADTTHEFASQTLPLPAFPDWLLNL